MKIRRLPAQPEYTAAVLTSTQPVAQDHRLALTQDLPPWAGELTKVRPLCNRERLAIYAYKAAWSGVRNI